MAAPDFSPQTRELLAFRAGLICSNPGCGALTAGPVESDPALALKIGEAAHIAAARPGPRYDPNMTDEARAHPDNGIWLCPSCHTTVDKNNGEDFQTPLLKKWKRDHEAMLKQLILSHRSPVPILRKFAMEGTIAQEVIDLLETHGALFVDYQMEYPQHVIRSIDKLRSQLGEIRRRIKYDSELKGLVKDLEGNCRKFMNYTSNIKSADWQELQNLRRDVGIRVSRLVDDYGCEVRGPLHRIVPAFRAVPGR